MARPSIPLELIETLDIVDESPNVAYLLEWAAKELDLTKVSSQTDLTRWLEKVVERESKRLGIDESEYKKRFKGMIKFFTQPNLGLKSVSEIQNEIAEDILESLEADASAIKDYEDLIRVIQDYKDVELPPLASQKIKNEFSNTIRKLLGYRDKVRSHKDYTEFLRELNLVRETIRTGRYKMLSRRMKRRLLFRIRFLMMEAERIRRDTGVPFGIFKRKLNEYLKKVRESLGRW